MVEFIVPSRNRPWRQSIFLALEEMFMPIHWRTACTPDYLAYQTYDSLQAIFSSISGMIASRETLVSLGVSRADATVGSALFLEVSSEAVSRLASILFSWAYAARLDAECKKYRFLADVFNDASLVLNTLSSSIASFPVRALVIIMAASLRALCGVCAGSSKAALTNHFARHPASVADINAKDGSQETLIYLIGLLLGSLIVPGLVGRGSVYTALGLLVGLHLWANYQAVRHVHLTSLNLPRLSIVLSAYLSSFPPSFLAGEGEGVEREKEEGQDGRIPTPAEVAERESILSFDTTGALLDMRFVKLKDLDDLPSPSVEEGEVMVYRRDRTILLALRHGATHVDLVHGIIATVQRQVSSRPPVCTPRELCRRMTAAGWDLERDAMAYDGLTYKRAD